MANKNYKEKDILNQIVRASDTIRQKHKMIKLGRDKTQQAMKEVFKPVLTPLEKLVTPSNQLKCEIKDEPADIHPKEEIDETYATAISENDNDYADGVGIDHTSNNSELNKIIDQFKSDDILFKSSPLKQTENNSISYLKKLFDNNKGLDTRFSVRKLKDNRLMMGDSFVYTWK
ncbi:hypothetical protein PV326_014356 [Microctonus aethiopoides]|uniref:Uncharacterized protein n=1 Tax=Microctonus aethiopoides TaxID=144406 RepID=A0AA39C4F9_9HYME|nr:hypothetical protein PV326_014356 [Microctonus aethiopoides]KAK0157235.1 hypothetical protein PV328_011714 [Microctonus aethiopoides]